MKVVILAGGLGTRISEESHLKPKPMIEIGEKPILWHIMKIYSHYGFNDFIICLGYKGHVVKEFFHDYYLYMSDITIDFQKHNEMTVHNNTAEPWRVTLVDTGMQSQTGGRIKRVTQFLENKPFLMTYGDGVSDVNITKLVEYHKQHGRLATMTTVKVSNRFGVIQLDKNTNIISDFLEKPKDDGAIINAGFMVLEPKVLDYIEGDLTVFENEPIRNLAKENQIVAYRHEGFWQCMDTQRDMFYLNTMWSQNDAPWKVW